MIGKLVVDGEKLFKARVIEQEGVTQPDLAALPSEALRMLQVQIAKEFNEREQLIRAENSMLRQERDQVENNYRKVAARATRQKQDEVSMKRSMTELCSELPHMHIEPEASILENIQKLVMRTQALALKMDTMEDEYKARIKELEKWDLTEQLKVDAKEITKQIVHQIEDTTHLLETNTTSWLGIEQIDTIKEVREEI